MAYWPDTGTGVDTQPARKPVQSAIRKYFTEGGIGQPPTVPGGDWFNQMTNEVLNVLEAAGIEPSKTDDDQLLQAISSICSDGVSYEALRRTYAESGLSLRPKPESFKNGGTLTSETDVLLDESSWSAFSSAGPFPLTVDPDTDPMSGAFVDRSGVLVRSQLQRTVLMYGADKNGTEDSTDAFVFAGPGAYVPDGTYKINDNLPGVYPAGENVIIVGNGTVKTKKLGMDLASLPFKIGKTTGGPLYTTGSSDITASVGEFYRLPVLSASQFNNRTFLAYSVLEGSSQDLGQSSTQTSRIEFRYSNNNLTFSPPVILSNDGEQQASEPAMVFDHKRGRLWLFYTTARGQVGVGHGDVGYDPDVTMQTWFTYSDDYGDSWTTPQNITSLVKPYDATSAWTPPSEICVASNGSLLVPYTWIKSGGMFYHGYIVVDEGVDGQLKYSRQLIVAGGRSGSNGGGEQQIIQLGDGSFIAMVRDYYVVGPDTKGLQCIYRSQDGLNWFFQSSINTTNCKAALCQYSSTAFGDSRDVLLISAPTGNDDSDLWRNNLHLWASTDSGLTWQEFTAPLFGAVDISTGYSSLAPLNNGAFLVAAEGALYGVINLRHKAIGSFTNESTFSKSWGGLPSLQNSAEDSLCQFFDVPNQSIYFNIDRQTLNLNAAGLPLRLTDSPKGLDINSPTLTLDSNQASTFYITVTTTLNQILGDAARVVIVSTQSAQPVTLVENSGVPIAERIRVNQVIAGKMIVLHRTKYGWYPDSGLAP